MGKYGEIQSGFMEERTRILDALDLPKISTSPCA